MRTLVAQKHRASRSARATERRKLLTCASTASTPAKPGIYAPALLPLRTGTILRWKSTTTTIITLPPSDKTCKRADVVLYGPGEPEDWQGFDEALASWRTSVTEPRAVATGF